MEIQQFNQSFVIRLDRGEEVVASLLAFAKDQSVTLGSFTGIGAVDRVELALYDPAAKQYYDKVLEGNFEVVPLAGNFTTMNGAPYVHCHINVSDEQFNSFGGHCKSARVSATLEVFVQTLPGTINRKPDPEIGLNLLDF